MCGMCHSTVLVFHKKEWNPNTSLCFAIKAILSVVPQCSTPSACITRNDTFLWKLLIFFNTGSAFCLTTAVHPPCSPSACAIRRFFPSSPEQPGQSWWAAAASVLGCPWFCWQEYKIEMPHRSTTRKNHKEYKWLTERSLFSQREDRSGDEARVCQEIFLTFPQCSCSSSLNSLLEFAQGQEKSDLGIFSQTVHIFSSKEEQAENSIPMVPLGNLEVA